MSRLSKGWTGGVLAAAMLIVLLLAGCGGVSSVPATLIPTPTPLPTPTPPPVVAVQSATLTAQAAYAVDLTTGVELYSLNADMPVAPASTMKIVTALLARKLLDPRANVTIAERDLVDPTVYSTMGLQAGDVVSVSDLLRGLLIPSGGDAGLALARVGGLTLGASTDGAVARFMDELNTFARNAGMTNSRFSNPVGDDAPDELSTARDLTQAATLLLNDQMLNEIVSTAATSVHVQGPNERDLELVNTNQLLTRDDVFGVKTGTETAAGQCLIAGFWRGGDQIIAVVLGSQDRYADTTALMDAIDAAYQPMARSH